MLNTEHMGVGVGKFSSWGFFISLPSLGESFLPAQAGVCNRNLMVFGAIASCMFTSFS